MKILNYIRSLLPDMEKKKIVQNLQSIKEELVDTTIPPLENAVKAYYSRRFNSDIVREFNSEFIKNVKSRGAKDNHLTIILRALRNASKVIEDLVLVFSKHDGDKVYRDGMTLLTANQLQYSEVATFAAGYTRRWMLFIYSIEIDVKGSDTDFKNSGEYEREKEYLDANKQNFFSAIKILSKTHSEVDKSFSEIPEIAVGPESPIDPSLVSGNSKVDPLQFGILPKPINFIYHFRMAMVNWELKNHSLMVEEKKQLELKLLMLNQLKDETNDPKLEKQIEISENRIEKLRYEIERMEEAAK